MLLFYKKKNIYTFKILLLFVLIIFSNFNLVSQEIDKSIDLSDNTDISIDNRSIVIQNIDSLNYELKSIKNNETKINSIDEKFQKKKAILLNRISIYNLNINNEVLIALEQAMLSLEICEKFDFQKEKIISLQIIIDSYTRTGYLTYAINYIDILLNHIEGNKKFAKIFIDRMINKGKFYFQLDDLVNAEISLLKGLSGAKENNFDDYQYSSLYHLGLLSNKQGKYLASNEYYKELLALIGNKNILFYKANSINNIGDNYEKLEDYDKAEKFYRLGLELNIAEKNFSGIGTSYLSLSDIAKLKGDFEKTVFYLKNSNSAFIEGDLLHYVVNNYKYLHKLFKEKKEFEKSLKYLEKSNFLLDSLFYFSREKSLELIEIEMGKKEKKNQILSLQLVNEKNNRYIIIGVFVFLIAIFIFLFNLKMRGNKINELELKEGKTKAELRSLQAKINPHFLFNSLNSISRLILKDSKAADKMIQNLSSLLRYTLQKAKLDKVTLSDEIMVVQKYLEIEKIRFGDRLEYDISVSDSIKDFFIPPLIIQPLIENSIKHGISNLISGGRIEVKCSTPISGNGLEIIVTDNGQSSSSTSSYSSKVENGFGLSYIKKTLNMVYRERFTLDITNDDSGYSVRILITG